MSGLGDTLRGARERRGETLAAAADAVGAEVTQLEALEGERLDDLPKGLDRAGLVDRYARHLELDPAWLAAELSLLESRDPDADTQPIPLISRPPKRDAGLIWVGAGVLLGGGALVLLGGGLRSDSSAPPSAAAPPITTTRATTTARAAAATTTTPADAQVPQVLQPEPADTPAIDLRLGARDGKTVWVEVRRGDVAGAQVFAGIVGGRATKRIRSSTPLWLGVAWAPNVTVSVNDEVIDAEGGTESYIVTQRGLRRLTNQ